MRFKISLLLLLPWLWTNSAADMNSVNDWTTKVGDLAKGSADPLRDLFVISTEVAGVMKVAAPAMSLITHAIKTNFGSGSLEIQALRALHKSMTEQFGTISNRIMGKMQELHSGGMLKDYKNEVQRPLNIMNELILIAANPTESPANREFHADHAKGQCKGNRSPLQILMWLEDYFVKNCHLMTRKQISLYADTSTALNTLDNIAESNFTALELDDYLEDKADFLYRITDLDDDMSNDEFVKSLEQDIKEIQKLGNPRHGIHDLLHSQRRFPRNANHEHDLCLFKEILIRHDFKRQELMALGEIVRLDLLHLMNIATFCVELTTDTAEKAAQLKAGMERRMEKIANHMYKWSTHHLDSSWPDIMINLAKDVPDEKKLTTHYSWNQTAMDISYALNARGPMGYNHQVLITEPWDYVQWFWADIDSNEDGFQLKKFKDLINIIVVRHKTDQKTIERVKNAQVEAAKMNKVAWQTLNDNWKNEDMAKLLRDINKKTGLSGPQKFRASILIHNSKWLGKWCEIHTGHSEDGVLDTDTSTYNYVHYHYNNFFYYLKNCEDFKLFYLL